MQRLLGAQVSQYRPLCASVSHILSGGMRLCLSILTAKIFGKRVFCLRPPLPSPLFPPKTHVDAKGPSFWTYGYC